MEKERRRWKVICPNKNCPHRQIGRPYTYFLETWVKPEYETCPLCGYFGETKDFQIEEVK